MIGESSEKSPIQGRHGKQHRIPLDGRHGLGLAWKHGILEARYLSLVKIFLFKGLVSFGLELILPAGV